MDLEFLQSELDYYPVTIHQFLSAPFALAFYHLSITGHLHLTARYIFLMFGGLLLAIVSMGHYALMVLIPAVFAVVLIHCLKPRIVHKWAFLSQMTWQTLCHLWLHYKEYYLQEATDTKFKIALSSLMLLTQRVTSVSLDILEGEIKIPARKFQQNCFDNDTLCYSLPYLSYMLYFPALLGGPLCSFQRFKTHVENLKKSDQKCIAKPLWSFFYKCIQFFVLNMLRVAVRNCVSVIKHRDQKSTQWNVPEDIFMIWTTALIFRLAYYSQWLLSESLNNLVGLGLENDTIQQSTLSDTDIWTLETTNKISEFVRVWNKTTAGWLRRMVFQRSKVQPFISTFIFSAWWHGLHPAQIFGFLLCAATVKVDYRVHQYMVPLTARSRFLRLFYKIVTWMQTQLVIAYVLVAVELRTLSCVLVLCKSVCVVSPLVYILMLIGMPKKAK
ncbi:ghrelin O-acyltransferase [Hemiscyllium ocellatum]|uniref:ghrelin O-acyltransferase n=1 Tax=Hemiscyllium ocellatum TaxID=170820 RepID=UPI0029667940|nr:ghrelin O-acyltransferase [Hemiscyllium ocellatum]